MEILEQFYLEEVKAGDMPEFSDLSDDQKKVLQNTMWFTGYKIRIARAELAKAIILEYPKLRKLLLK